MRVMSDSDSRACALVHFVKTNPVLVVCFLSLFAVSAAIADNQPMQFNGAALKSSCNASLERQSGKPIPLNDVILATMCRSYVVGFIESSAFNEGVRSFKPPFCVPAGVSADQVVRAVHAFATLHQAMLDLPAAAFVAASLQEKFPCTAER